VVKVGPHSEYTRTCLGIVSATYVENHIKVTWVFAVYSDWWSLCEGRKAGMKVVPNVIEIHP
jgi:hypothetical protein